MDEEEPKGAPPEERAATASVESASGESRPTVDRALVLGPVDDKSFAILRKRGADAPLEAGVVRPMREGEPIAGELVSLERADASAPLFDVKVHYDGRPSRAAAHSASSKSRATQDAGERSALPHKGPARVTSDAFRDGWDAVFRERKPN